MAQSAEVDASNQHKTVSEKVMYAVAEETDSTPRALDPLYHVIEPDALETLIETSGVDSRRSPTRVSFTYSGCDVVVSSDGSVTVSKLRQ